MEVESLRQEVLKLKTEKAALKAKSELFENFAAMAHSCCRRPSTAEWKTIKSTLKKTLAFSAELTGAENGSLVLLDSNGVVTDSILIPGDTARDQSSQLIGKTLDKDLAGWVKAHHQIGLVNDIYDDDRCQPPLTGPKQYARCWLSLFSSVMNYWAFSPWRILSKIILVRNQLSKCRQHPIRSL